MYFPLDLLREFVYDKKDKRIHSVRCCQVQRPCLTGNKDSKAIPVSWFLVPLIVALRLFGIPCPYHFFKGIFSCMNIYVGNLSYQADEQNLTDLFSVYGKVRNVRVITDRETGRPRGFGFVEMESAESGRNAISALNGKDYMGRQLNINEAQPRQARSGGFRSERRYHSRY